MLLNLNVTSFKTDTRNQADTIIQRTCVISLVNHEQNSHNFKKVNDNCCYYTFCA